MMIQKIAFFVLAITAVQGFHTAPLTGLSVRRPVHLSKTNLWASSPQEKGLSSAVGADIPMNNESIKQPSLPVVLWKFSRPHTIIGSALAIPTLHMLAAPSVAAAFSRQNLVSILFALLPGCLMNLYITGLNQITDIEIDKVNKPNLPIAAGILSKNKAIVIVLTALVASFMLGVSHPLLGTTALNTALWGSCILGTIYSLEPFRFKRFPFLAAFCIVAVRGAMINASFFAHAKVAAFGAPDGPVLQWLLNDRTCFLSSLFFAVFGLVIALMKDVPDVIGDRMANIRTMSVRLGQKQVFGMMKNLLSGLFLAVGAAFIRGAAMAPNAGLAICRSITSICAMAASWSVNKEAKTVNAEDSGEVYSYYMHLWKLFYLSYLVLPFAK